MRHPVLNSSEGAKWPERKRRKVFFIDPLAVSVKLCTVLLAAFLLMAASAEPALAQVFGGPRNFSPPNVGSDPLSDSDSRSARDWRSYYWDATRNHIDNFNPWRGSWASGGGFSGGGTSSGPVGKCNYECVSSCSECTADCNCITDRSCPGGYRCCPRH